MPNYLYRNEKTEEIIEVMRPISERNLDYISPDGEVCKRIFYNPKPPDTKSGRRSSRAGQKLEVFQASPDLCKKLRPKYVVYQDKHRELYDPNKHC